MYKKHTKHDGFIHKLLIEEETRKQLHFDVQQKAQQVKEKYQKQVSKVRAYVAPKVLGKKIFDRQDQNSKYPYSVIGYGLLRKDPTFFLVDRKDNKNYFKGNSDCHTIVKEAFVLQDNVQSEFKSEYVYRRKKLTNRELKKLFDELMKDPKIEEMKKQQKNLQLFTQRCWERFVNDKHETFKKREIDDATVTQKIYPEDKYVYPTFEGNCEDQYSFDYQITSRSFLKNRGVSVHQFLQNLPDDKRLTLTNIIQLWSSLASAVKVVHDAGFYHGDIKFNNILIDPKTLVASCVDFELSRSVESMSHKDLISRLNCYASPQLFCFDEAQLKRLYPQKELLNSELYNLALVMLESLLFFDKNNDRSVFNDVLREIRPLLIKLQDVECKDDFVRARHEDAYGKMQRLVKEIFMEMKKLFSSSKDNFLLDKMEKLLDTMINTHPENSCDIDKVVKECDRCNIVSKVREFEFKFANTLKEIVSVLDYEVICDLLEDEKKQEELKKIYQECPANVKTHDYKIIAMESSKTFCLMESLACLVKEYCVMINDDKSLTEGIIADAFKLCGFSSNKCEAWVEKMSQIVGMNLQSEEILYLNLVAKVFSRNKGSTSGLAGSEKQQLFHDYVAWQKPQKIKELVNLQKELNRNSEKLQNMSSRKKNFFGWKTKVPGKFAQKIAAEHQKIISLVKSGATDLADVALQRDICERQNKRYMHCIEHYDNHKVFDGLLHVLPKSAIRLQEQVKKVIAQINPDNCEKRLKDIFSEIFIYLYSNNSAGKNYTILKKVGDNIVAKLGLSSSLMFDIYFDLFESLVSEADIKDAANLERYNQWMIKHFASDEQLLNQYNRCKRDFVRCKQIINFVKNAIEQYQEKTPWQKFTGFFRKKSEIAKSREQNIQELLGKLTQNEGNGSDSLLTLLQSINNAILNSIKADVDVYRNKWKNRPSKFRESLIQVKRCLFAACSVYDMPDLMSQEKKYFNAIVGFAEQQSACKGECGEGITIDFYKACGGIKNVLLSGNIELSHYLAQFKQIVNSYDSNYFADHAKYYRVDFNSLFEDLSISYKCMEESLRSKRHTVNSQGKSSQNTSNIFTGLNINPSDKVVKVKQIKNQQNLVQVDNNVPTKKLEQTSNSEENFNSKPVLV